MSGIDNLIASSSALTGCQAWKALQRHAGEIASVPIAELLDQPNRYADFSLEAAGLLLDYSRNRMSAETVGKLLVLASERKLPEWIEAMFDGEAINTTEQRPALHVALRNSPDQPIYVNGENIMPAVHAELDKACAFADALRSGRHTGHTGAQITDVVNIGIGGSDLGLVMVSEALSRFATKQIRLHFVSNIDGVELDDVLSVVDPATTLFIICSKSFTTLETRLNADAAREWFLTQAPAAAIGRHFVAVSVNDSAMDAFGIDSANRFRIWDWVGGRYSLWSAIGLSLAIGLGPENFRALLNGASEMDQHFRSAAPAENLPVMLALAGIWNRNFQAASSHAVLPYDRRLHRLPAFLQQLDMESNGKRITRDGVVSEVPTGPVIWGEPGSNAQHSFFQLLHQGTADASIDFIAPARGSSRFASQHLDGLANMLAQAEAFARGRSESDVDTELKAAGLGAQERKKLVPHKVHPGNRPSNIILFDELTPRALGALIAMYEHKVFVQSVIWGINAFDQWGVELGKRMATEIAAALSGDVGDDELPGIAARLRSRQES